MDVVTQFLKNEYIFLTLIFYNLCILLYVVKYRKPLNTAVLGKSAKNYAVFWKLKYDILGVMKDEEKTYFSIWELKMSGAVSRAFRNL